MAVGARIYSRMFLDRLRPQVDPSRKIIKMVSEKVYRTQILTLRRLVAGSKSKKKLPAIITVVDSVRLLIPSTGGNLCQY